MTNPLLPLALAACAAVPAPFDADTDVDVADTVVDEPVDSEPVDSDPGPVEVTCSDSVERLTLDDVTPFGVSVRQLFDAAAKVTRADGAWSVAEGGAATTVTVTLASAGAPRFHDLEVATGEGGPRDCVDWLEVPATLDVDTAEGRLDEAMATTLHLERGALPDAAGVLDALELRGTLVLQSVDPSAWDATELRVAARWTRTGLEGEVTVHATRTFDGAPAETFDGPVLAWP